LSRVTLRLLQLTLTFYAKPTTPHTQRFYMTDMQVNPRFNHMHTTHS
jgi:hypothetical protein